MILNGNEQRNESKRGEMRGPDNSAIRVSHRPDIGCGLAGPGTERGMGICPGMLVVIDGRSRMDKGTSRRDEQQRQVEHGDAKGHDSG